MSTNRMHSNGSETTRAPAIEMPKKRATFGRFFQSAIASNAVKQTTESYGAHFGTSADAQSDADAASITNVYYDLATEFYEWGWGKSFHFAPLARGESLKESLIRYEHYVALKLRLNEGSRVLDAGCGVGGPMRSIARVSGAHIVGLNINKLQIEHARKYNQEQGLARRCEIVEGDFTKMPFEAESFDAAYAMESTCHARDRGDVFADVFRVLKPGGLFATCEWCTTDRYDPTNPEHREIKWGIEKGDGLPEMTDTHTVEKAIKAAGFEVIDAHDHADTSDPKQPWYSPLAANVSLKGLMYSRTGSAITHGLVKTLETLRLSPEGTTFAHDLLRLAQSSLVQGGRAGIFTPMFFVLARKPEATKTNGKTRRTT